MGRGSRLEGCPASMPPAPATNSTPPPPMPSRTCAAFETHALDAAPALARSQPICAAAGHRSMLPGCSMTGLLLVSPARQRHRTPPDRRSAWVVTKALTRMVGLVDGRGDGEALASPLLAGARITPYEMLP